MKFKLSDGAKNLVIVFLAGSSISYFLMNAIPNKNETYVEKNESIEKVYTNSEGLEQYEDYSTFSNKQTNNTIEETLQINDSIDNINETIKERKGPIKNEKKTKEKLHELLDFVFNGKEINGVTFSDLKEEEKERIIAELNEVDDKVEEYFPEYKERLHNWLDKKESSFKDFLIEKGADLKEIWEQYTSDVEEEYTNRQFTK